MHLMTHALITSNDNQQSPLSAKWHRERLTAPPPPQIPTHRRALTSVVSMDMGVGVTLSECACVCLFVCVCQFRLAALCAWQLKQMPAHSYTHNKARWL